MSMVNEILLLADRVKALEAENRGLKRECKNWEDHAGAMEARIERLRKQAIDLLAVKRTKAILNVDGCTCTMCEFHRSAEAAAKEKDNERW